MKTEIVHSLTATFEGHAQQTEGGVDYWLARDLQHLLGYSKWDNFLNVVAKAKVACPTFCPVKFASGTRSRVEGLKLLSNSDPNHARVGDGLHRSEDAAM